MIGRKGTKGKGGMLNEKGGTGRVRTNRITVCFSDEEYEKVKAAIEGDGRSASVIVREQILRWATEIPEEPRNRRGTPR